MVRLKVQIILCTYCLDEGRTEALSRLDGGKGGGRVGQDRLVWRAGRRVSPGWGVGGVGLGCFSIEVRGGGVEAGSLKV